MKKLTLTLLILFFFQLTVSAQPCLPEGITFTFQMQIDNFQINYPNCTEIEGDVIISGLGITNLHGLDVLTSVGGNLYIGKASAPGGGNPHLTNLAGLDNMTSVNGSLQIFDNDSLQSLSGLNSLEYIGGFLDISDNGSLTNLDGLGNLSSTDGLIILLNNSLISLDDLGLLDSLNSGLAVANNTSLTNLMGLENIIYLGRLTIEGTSLSSLNGLENLVSIGGDIDIFNNVILNNLSALDGVTSIGGHFWIEGNETLTSLSGLDNIDAGTITTLLVRENPSLSTCEVQSVCEYIVAPSGGIEIENNAPGCNNIQEVIEACYINPCLPEGITFTTQAEIDNFQTNYPNCTEIEGHVGISGDDITNLNGLNVLISIGGFLWIEDNNALTNLSGLEELILIGGSLVIIDNSIASISNLSSLSTIGINLFISGNNSLTSLTGLNNITTIEDSLYIWNNHLLSNLTGLDNLTTNNGDVWIAANNNLENLSGLDNLSTIGGVFDISGNPALSNLNNLNSINTIGGDFFITANDALINLSGLGNLSAISGDLEILYNDALTSLIGLDNLDASSIHDLNIHDNMSLSVCDAESICDYLFNPSGEINIYDNAPGCNNQQEVEEACELSVWEIPIIEKLTINPNPFFNRITFKFELRQSEIITITIYNHLGEKLKAISERKSVGQQKIEWNCEGLSAGIYFCVLKTNEGIQTRKIVKF